MKLNTLSALLHDQLKDLHSAESQLTKALPKMAKQAHAAPLKAAIEAHLDETREQLERLQQVGDLLDLKLAGKKCQAMQGLIEEGSEVLESEADEVVSDLAIIAAAQRVEHYEIAAYGTAREMASQLGHSDVVKLLQTTLDEEGEANKKLTAIALGLYKDAPTTARTAAARN